MVAKSPHDEPEAQKAKGWRQNREIYLQYWLVVSNHLQNISQNGNLPQFFWGENEKYKNVRNHFLRIYLNIWEMVCSFNELEIPSFFGKLCLLYPERN